MAFIEISNKSRTDTLPFDQALQNQLEREAESNTLSLVYKNKWVGFPEIAGHDCKTALYSKATNNLFPQTVKRIHPSEYIEESRDCISFIKKYGFNRHPRVTQEERDFPIAFIILFYKDLDQVSNFFKAFSF